MTITPYTEEILDTIADTVTDVLAWHGVRATITGGTVRSPKHLALAVDWHSGNVPDYDTCVAIRRSLMDVFTCETAGIDSDTDDIIWIITSDGRVPSVKVENWPIAEVMA